MEQEWGSNIRRLILSSAFLCSWLAAKPALTVPATALAFEPNVGQANQHARFLAHTPHGMLWLTEDGAILGVAAVQAKGYFEMRFEGANTTPAIGGEDKRPGISNYFIGNDRRNWRTDVAQFGKVRYRDVYPGIDVVFYGNPSNLEYDFVLSPGADPSRIRLAFPGASKLSTGPDGSLAIRAGEVQFRNLPPLIAQDGKRVAGHWKLLGKNRAGFVIDRFDRSKPLVIDPVLTYATYLGGGVSDATGGSAGAVISGIAVDTQGNIIAAGITDALDFPTHDALYGSIPGRLLSATTFSFVTKINPALSGTASLVYSTFFIAGTTGMVFGGSINALAVDHNGNAYFTGQTGDNLPVQSPLQGQSAPSETGCTAIVDGQPTPNSTCQSAYISEISAAGNSLLFSSYLGGSNIDEGFAVAVDAQGNIYVAGGTTSFDFPLAGNFIQAGLNGGPQSGFVSKISPNHTLLYSTNFGSGGTDSIRGVTADSNGRIFIAGLAGGTGLPIGGGGFQSTYPGGANQPTAAFAAIINPTAQPPLIYSTYLGGTDLSSAALAVATDGTGNIYLAGTSQATNFPVTSSAVRGPGGGVNMKAFVTKLIPSAQGKAQLAYSTILGGSYVDLANAIAVDSTGRITVAGQTSSPNFQITANAYQPDFVGIIMNGNISPLGFLAQIDPTLSGAASLTYSSFVGGGGNDGGSILNSVALDATGKIVAIGGVSTQGAPVSSAYQPTERGNGDGYLARFDMSQTGPGLSNIQNAASLSADPNGTVSPGMIVTLKGTALGPSIATNGTIDPSSGKVSTNVAGVQVLINNTPCPLLYISATQINAIAPYELTTQLGNFVTVEVIYNGVGGNVIYGFVNATNPGIFSFDDGSGQGAILNQDGTVNGPSNAAARGTLIQIFATGEGQTVPPGVDGAIANEPVANIPHPAASVSLTIGGVAVPASAITYAGTLPGGVAGALQIDAMIPANAPTGSAIPIVLTIGKSSSPKSLTAAVQ